MVTVEAMYVDFLIVATLTCFVLAIILLKLGKMEKKPSFFWTMVQAIPMLALSLYCLVKLVRLLF